jgi:hypothetical protein
MTSAHATGRIRGANLVDYRAAAFRQPHLLEPGQQLFISQHEISFLFLSLVALFLQCTHQPHSSFVRQLMQLTAIVDGLLDRWRQFIRYINREPM